MRTIFVILPYDRENDLGIVGVDYFSAILCMRHFYKISMHNSLPYVSYCFSISVNYKFDAEYVFIYSFMYIL